MEEKEGGREWRGEKKEEGASAAYLHLYINSGFGNQTQEKPTASKNTLGALHVLPIFQQRKH